MRKWRISYAITWPLSKGRQTQAFSATQRSKKCWQMFLELNSKGLCWSLGKLKEIRCLAFTSSIKREIGPFHNVVVQWQQWNVQNSVMHVQSCCFAYLNLLLFCHFRCRCRRHCLSSLLALWETFGDFDVPDKCKETRIQKDWFST